MNYSESVSRWLAKSIVSRATSLCRHKARMTNITLKSQEMAQQYPANMTTQLIHFDNLSPSRQISLPVESVSDHPKSPAFRQKFEHSSAVPSPMHPSKSVKTISRENSRFRISHQPNLEKGECIKIETKEESDEEIEVLRMKKQKLYDMEAYFKESEKKDRLKPKVEKIKGNFTTDFNGEQLELNPTKRRMNNDSYARVELTFTMKEEREDHRRLETEESSGGKPKRSKQLQMKNVSKKILVSQQLMEVNENLPLREMHKEFKKTLFNTTNRSKQSREDFPQEVSFLNF